MENANAVLLPEGLQRLYERYPLHLDVHSKYVQWVRDDRNGNAGQAACGGGEEVVSQKLA